MGEGSALQCQYPCSIGGSLRRVDLLSALGRQNDKTVRVAKAIQRATTWFCFLGHCFRSMERYSYNLSS